MEEVLRAGMQEKMTELVPGSTLDSLDCARRQGNEFSCIAEMTAPDGAATITASVTCETECIWSMDNYALKP